MKCSVHVDNGTLDKVIHVNNFTKSEAEKIYQNKFSIKLRVFKCILLSVHNFALQIENCKKVRLIIFNDKILKLCLIPFDENGLTWWYIRYCGRRRQVIAFPFRTDYVESTSLGTTCGTLSLLFPPLLLLQDARRFQTLINCFTPSIFVSMYSLSETWIFPTKTFDCFL